MICALSTARGCGPESGGDFFVAGDTNIACALPPQFGAASLAAGKNGWQPQAGQAAGCGQYPLRLPSRKIYLVHRPNFTAIVDHGGPKCSRPRARDDLLALRAANEKSGRHLPLPHQYGFCVRTKGWSLRRAKPASAAMSMDIAFSINAPVQGRQDRRFGDRDHGSV